MWTALQRNGPDHLGLFLNQADERAAGAVEELGSAREEAAELQVSY